MDKFDRGKTLTKPGPKGNATALGKRVVFITDKGTFQRLEAAAGEKMMSRNKLLNAIVRSWLRKQARANGQ